MSDQKEKEEKSLREVFEFARKKRGRSHRILHDLEGEVVEREDNERPDFILRVSDVHQLKQKNLIYNCHIFHFDLHNFRIFVLHCIRPKISRRRPIKLAEH